MISVQININGNCIMARSAVNKREMVKDGENVCVYEMDDGNKILHKPDDGAVELAIKMLKKIKEVKK